MGDNDWWTESDESDPETCETIFLLTRRVFFHTIQVFKKKFLFVPSITDASNFLGTNEDFFSC